MKTPVVVFFLFHSVWLEEQCLGPTCFREEHGWETDGEEDTTTSGTGGGEAPKTVDGGLGTVGLESVATPDKCQEMTSL